MNYELIRQCESDLKEELTCKTIDEHGVESIGWVDGGQEKYNAWEQSQLAAIRAKYSDYDEALKKAEELFALMMNNVHNETAKIYAQFLAEGRGKR